LPTVLYTFIIGNVYKNTGIFFLQEAHASCSTSLNNSES